MLPSCERLVRVSRRKYLPSHNRKIPVPSEPSTLGHHLRRRRLELNVFQAQAAQQLGVSMRTLSLWECDKLHPTWQYWPRIVEYLGFNPFVNPALGGPSGNKRSDVACSEQKPPDTYGRQIMRRRLEMWKSQKKLADELGVDVKTLSEWEMNRHSPSSANKKIIDQILFRHK